MFLDVNLLLLGVFSKLDIIYRIQGVPELASRLACGIIVLGAETNIFYSMNYEHVSEVETKL